MNKVLFTILLTAFGAGFLAAQGDLSTHFLRHSWQANKTNPALFPDYGFSLGLPGVYNSNLITNLTYNDLVTKGENGENLLDIDNAITKLGDENIIRENLDIETISLGMRFGPLAISIGHSLRYNAYLNYPRELPALIWQGNAQFVGQEISFGPDVDLFGYQEFALGLAGELTPNITIGGRVKLLAGVGEISSEQQELRLYTDDDIYQLRLTADYLLNSAGSLEYGGFNDFTVAFDFGRFDAGELFTGNTGFAFDLGLLLRFGKLEVAASALDIGSINWEEEVANYRLDGVYEYDGIDLSDNIFNDSTTVGSVLDTLEAIFEVVETNNTFRRTLPARYYLSGLYHLSDSWQVGALFYGEEYLDEFRPAVAISSNMDVLPFLNVGAQYAYRDERFDNIGLNATVKVGPLQVMAATDNIISAFRPKGSSSANLRLGINLLFAKRNEERRVESEGENFFD